MTEKSLILFLFYFSVFNGFIWLMGMLLERFKTHTVQKVFFYKFSLILSIGFIGVFTFLYFYPVQIVSVTLLETLPSKASKPFSIITNELPTNWFELTSKCSKMGA